MNVPYYSQPALVEEAPRTPSAARLPPLLSSVVASLRLDVKTTPLSRLLELLARWAALLVSLAAQMDLPLYRAPLAASLKTLKENEFLLADCVESVQPELGIVGPVDLSWKQLQRRCTSSTSRPIAEEGVNSVTDNLECLLQDVVDWLGDSLAGVLSLERPAVAPGILQLSQQCCDATLAQTHSDLRKR